MDIKTYIDKIREKVKHYDKTAQNPFLKTQFEYNPFKGAFTQTYIWVEPDEENAGSANGDDGTSQGTQK